MTPEEYKLEEIEIEFEEFEKASYLFIKRLLDKNRELQKHAESLGNMVDEVADRASKSKSGELKAWCCLNDVVSVLQEVLPVLERMVNDDNIGPVYQKLQNCYEQIKALGKER